MPKPLLRNEKKAYSEAKVTLQGTCYWYRKKAKKESEVIEQKSQGKPFRSLQRSRILIRRENVTKLAETS